jgi:hypothetical protein
MQVHVVNIAPVNVHPLTGARVNKSQSINDVIMTDTAMRIIPNAAVPNSANYPTLEQYLTLEAAGNYKLQHLDQTTVITYNG